MRVERMLATAAVAAVLGTTSITGARAQTDEAPLVEPEAGRRTLLVALVGDNRLVTINADSAKVVSRVLVQGTSGRLIGIDVRPANGKLYGVDTTGAVFIINPVDGTTMYQSQLTPQKLPDGVRASLDFNPVVDRLRMIGSDGSNLRADVDTGLVAADTNINFVLPNPFLGTAPGTPEVIAAAYSNSVAGAKATLLWDIDNTTDALYLQIPPGAGSLNAVGNQLGINPGNVGFDIQTLSNGDNRAWLINNTVLYRLGLVSGIAQNPKQIRGLNGVVRDVAVLPN